MPDLARGATLRRLSGELSALDSQSQLRTLALSPGIDLMSNDYLGLSRHPKLRQAIAGALERGEAMASAGSRLLAGNARIWQEIEEEFAAFAGFEAALLFNTGYAANIGLLASLLRPEDIVLSDRSNHASLIDGIRLSRARKIVFPHLDLNFLEDRLRGEAARTGEKFIVVESVFSMEGDRAPLNELAALSERYGAGLIVDEAHATGVFGAEGRGLVADAGLSSPPLAAVFTCGKALASSGAFVACSSVLKEYLVNHARTFIFSTALPPYLGHQVRAALTLARNADRERENVHRLASELRATLHVAGLGAGASNSQIVPVMLGSNERALAAATALTRAGFAIRAIRPPAVAPGTSRLRISVNATLSTDTIDRIAQTLATAGL